MTAVVEAPVLAEAARLRLLALALAPTGKESLAEVEALAGALAERPGARPELAELAEAAASLPLEEVAVARERLFAPDAVSPYEASIELDPFRQARQMADVAGFYGAFGAQAHGPAADRPDHAGTEVEFLAFLALRRLQAADTGEAARCAEIEASFLSAHAGRWLPPFFRALEEAAEDSYHRALGRLGAAVIEEEVARRGLDVEQVAAVRGARLSVEADEIECGAAGLQAPFEAVASPHRRRRRG